MQSKGLKIVQMIKALYSTVICRYPLETTDRTYDLQRDVNPI